MKPCKQCGVGKARRDYCSTRCRNRAKYLRHYSRHRLYVQRRYYTKVRKRLEKNCAWCGNMFVTHMTRQKFCSKRCSICSASRTYYNKKRKRVRVPYVCPCGKSVIPGPGRGQWKFCSLAHQKKYTQRRLRGMNRERYRAIDRKSGRKATEKISPRYIVPLLKRQRIPVTEENIQRKRIGLRAVRSRRALQMLNAVAHITYGSGK